MKSVFAFAALFASYAAAQSPTTSAAPPINTSNIPPCVLQCGTEAAQNSGCSSILDFACLCSSTKFQTAALQCLQSKCTVEEQQAGVTLEQQFCGSSVISTMITAARAHLKSKILPYSRAPFTSIPLVPSIEPRSILHSNSALSTFLLNNKKAFLDDLPSNKGEGWTIVMGNESGDLDSCASALAYSYLSTIPGDDLTITAIPDNKRTIALIQTPRADLSLRAENLLAFSLAHLAKDCSDLLTIDDITAWTKLEDLRSSYALVDHNKLLSKFLAKEGSLVSAERVTAILDHHRDDEVHPDAKPRIIRSAGSCASIVTDYFKTRFPLSPELEDPITDVSALLLTAIVIDTNGLKTNGKTTELDAGAFDCLYPRTPFGRQTITGGAPNEEKKTLPELTELLITSKRDVSHLSGYDLLRRDYKEFEWNNSKGELIRVGLSTVPMGLKRWIERDKKKKFWADQQMWIKERNLAVSGVLTTFRTRTKNKHKREILLVFPQTEGASDAPSDLELKLHAGITSNSELGANKMKKEKKKILGIQDKRAEAWEQTEKRATRKQIAPAIKVIIEKS
ncbi:hypothetical protein RSOLAG22IIIB_13852 [Rhizoctonia solani]|uniref:CFEM domain-containing protein n=1 Tax=Rhizoctonia solani TaxID=456999 RepID=A0A0K6FRQ5_9AGAM|nr:unnamed protein product [Rhizoctonia solani]CUA68906.1 hypothetical protein RSOLAG22IIIB_13852 [Rhizoctonia solani]